MIFVFLIQTDKTKGSFWCQNCNCNWFSSQAWKQKLTLALTSPADHADVLVGHLLFVVEVTVVSRLAHSVHSTPRSRINGMNSKDFLNQNRQYKTRQKYIPTILIPEWLPTKLAHNINY